MIFGQVEAFAIECVISEAYSSVSIKANGIFVIYLDGFRFGIRETNATALGGIIGRLLDRVSMRGKHHAPFAEKADAEKIALALLEVFYSDHYSKQDSKKLLLNTPYSKLEKICLNSDLRWAPGGEEAFDDGSHVLQFDIGDKVRLVGFIHQPGFVPSDLRDVWLPAELFYGTLVQCYHWFEREWGCAEKVDIDMDSSR
jgi:hypothetical protein